MYVKGNCVTMKVRKAGRTANRVGVKPLMRCRKVFSASRVFVYPFVGMLSPAMYLRHSSTFSGGKPCAVSQSASRSSSLAVNSVSCIPFYLLRCIQLGCPCCDHSILLTLVAVYGHIKQTNNVIISASDVVN